MFVLFLCLFFVPREAQAYIDPGSGSFFFQMLIAGVLGAVFHFRRWLGRTIFFFKKKPAHPPVDDSNI